MGVLCRQQRSHQAIMFCNNKAEKHWNDELRRRVVWIFMLVSLLVYISNHLRNANSGILSSDTKKTLNLRQLALPSFAGTTDNSYRVANKSVRCFRHVQQAGDYPHRYIWTLAKEIFPECGGKATPFISGQRTPSAQSNSLLFFPQNRQKQALKEFPGTVLFFKAEPAIGLVAWNEMRESNWFSVGHDPNSSTSIHFPLLAQRIAALNAEDCSKIFDKELRPRNTGRYFLIYAQTNRVTHRENAFNELASIDVVHWGGQCKGADATVYKTKFCAPREKNPSDQVKESQYHQEQKFLTNGIYKVPIEERQSAVRTDYDNRHAYNDYRFALVMENRHRPGYITEKILFAFLGGAIPIWYGTKDIFNIINKDAFIYYDIENPKPALKLIRNLEKNRTAYMQMLSQPILADGANTIEQYFSASDDIGGGLLKKKVRQMVGYDAES